MPLTKITSATLANNGNEFGMRNRVINGAMRVDQRNAGAAQTFTAAAVLAYCVDRFYGYCTGANITGQQVTVSGKKRYRFTGAASNTAVGFCTRLESINTADMASQDAVLQVKLSSSSLTSIGWAVYHANTTDTFGSLASPTRTLVASGTFTITSTEATYEADVPMLAGATTGLEIVFTGGALLAAQTLTIGDMQFELGTERSAFEWRSYHYELAECQRYFANVPTHGIAVSTSLLSFTLHQPVTMRASPATSFSGALRKTSDGVNSSVVSGLSIVATAKELVYLVATFDVPLVVGQAYDGLTSGIVGLSAEL